MKTETVVIDDHLLVNDGLSLILQESGYFEVIEQLYDSRYAIFTCYVLRPQLILIDYNMPYLNGLEVVKQLKTLNLDAKIVIVSMYADKREMAHFKEEGVDAFISKTTPAFKLINALRSVMQGEKIFENVIKNKEVLEKDAFALKHELTKREMEILILVKQGHSTETIADMLNVSFYTVETHRKNVNQKMKFKNKKEFYDFLDEIDDTTV